MTSVDNTPRKGRIYTSLTLERAMRTNIFIDDRLMRQAMAASRLPTKRATVEEGLRLLVQTKAQTRIRRLRGKVTWEGNLETMRARRIR